MTVRIAMWSGPRNISTALMRAWENRPDTAVCDEPLYASYLSATGAPHPGAEEVIRHGPTDWRVVVEGLIGPAPGDAPVWYQKHMAHHLLPGIDRGWLGALRHGFLIRDPREMLLSLSRVTPSPTVEDTGLPQQVALFEAVRNEAERVPPVLDARDVLERPRVLLERLCAAWELPFAPEMLSWPPGPRSSDGVWGRHWYASVWRSTGFQSWRAREGVLSAELEAVRRECAPYYEALAAHRLR